MHSFSTLLSFKNIRFFLEISVYIALCSRFFGREQVQDESGKGYSPS